MGNISLEKELFDMIAGPDEGYIQNDKAFRMDYVPDELVERDDEIKKIFGSLRKSIYGKSQAKDIILYGQKGTGKTSTIKKVLEYLRKASDKQNGVGSYYYVSARRSGGIIELLHELLNIERESYYNTKGDYWNLIKRRVENEYLTLVFDDFDKFERVYEEQSQVLLDKLLDMDMVSIVLIGNRKGFEKIISEYEDNMSRAKPKSIIFDQYSDDHLFQIIKQRAQFLRDDVYDDDILRYLVECIDEGDARMGIKVLEYAAEEAEEENVLIDENHVDYALNEFAEAEDLTYIASLKKEYIGFLEAMIEVIDNNEPPIMKYIHYYFKDIVEKRDIKIKSEATFYRYAKTLDETYNVIDRERWENNRKMKVHYPNFDTESFLDSLTDLYNT